MPVKDVALYKGFNNDTTILNFRLPVWLIGFVGGTAYKLVGFVCKNVGWNVEVSAGSRRSVFIKEKKCCPKLAKAMDLIF